MTYLPPLVFCGHDIHHDALSPSPSLKEVDVSISVGELASILEAARTRGYRFVTLPEFLSERRLGGVALLTFDDAYCSIREIAGPLLAKEKVPATVFVITGALDQADPLENALMVLRDSGNFAASKDRALHAKILETCGLSNEALLAKPFKEFARIVTTALSSAEQADLAAAITTAQAGRRMTMTAHEVRDLPRQGMWSLGAHSVSHRSFSALPPAQVAEEILSSVRKVAELAGLDSKDVPFAYPYGAHTVQAARLVSQVCLAGFTCAYRPVSALDTRALLPRYNLDLRRATSALAQQSAPSWKVVLRERALLHARSVRHTPVWNFIRPLREALRRKPAA